MCIRDRVDTMRHFTLFKVTAFCSVISSNYLAMPMLNVNYNNDFKNNNDCGFLKCELFLIMKTLVILSYTYYLAHILYTWGVNCTKT